jgi:vitamin B12 transporter
VRDGYLKWLTVHEAQGARFASGETSHRPQVGEVQLVGRRFDRDNETRPLGGYGLVNLTAKWAMSKATSLELRADNVFDKFYTNALSANGSIVYATPGASVFAGLRYNH